MDQIDKSPQQQEPELAVSDQEDEEYQKKDWNIILVRAAQKSNLAEVKKAIDKGAKINFEEKKWNALMWAACKGSVEITRYLIQKQATLQYVQYDQFNFSSTFPGGSPQHLAQSQLNMEGQSPSPFGNTLQQISKKVTMGVINPQNKASPLQWACFKGHIQIVWLLLKEGLSWEDVDQFGNNSVHLATSGGSLQVFITLLFWGVAIDRQNTRGHTAKDLATNVQIIALIKQQEGHQNSNNKHYCMTCRQFYTANDFRLEWMYESAEANVQEKPEGRCVTCWNVIQEHTDDLNQIIEKQDHKLLTEKINMIEVNKIEIDPKSFKRALIEQEKLRTQNVILDFISTLKVVPNYKTILKSVKQINDYLEDAVARNVHIDDHVKEIAQKEMDRLVAERNLQFCLDNMDSAQANIEDVQELNVKVQSAQQLGVAPQYIEQASALRDKMDKAIKAKRTLKMFNEYPAREIPDPIKWDPKTKKPIDPITNKPIDPLKLAIQNQKQKKKPGKKEPKFVIPEWANDIKSLDESIKTLETLLKESETLNLSKEFNDESIQQIKRMKNEMRYRKQIDDELKLIADAKAAEKKKNK